MTKYLVSLWSGRGYALDSIEVEANDVIEALEIAVVNGLGWAFEEGTADYDELSLMDEYNDEGIEAWYYIDLSKYGKPNVYVNLEHARIDELE